MSQEDSEKTAELEGQVPGLESQSNAEQLPLLRRVRARLQMILLFLVGVILAIGHHLYNHHLSGRPVGTHVIHGQNINQEISGAISNAFGIAVQTAFATAIGITLVQRFWHHVDVRQLGAKDIGALYSASSGKPLSPSSIPSWWIATTFSLLAFTSTIMTLVPVIAPGALTVSLSGSPQPCLVNTSMIQNASIALYHHSGSTVTIQKPTVQALVVVNKVVASGSYLTPPSPCGVCSYEVNFLGAAMNCSNVTATYDFGPWLNVSNLPDDSAPLWSGNLSLSTNVTFFVTMQDGNAVAMWPSALQCTAYLANYTVEVNHQETNSTITLKNVDVDQVLDPSNGTYGTQSEATGLAIAVGTLLAGNVTYNYDHCDYIGAGSEVITTPPPMALSPFLHQINCDSPNTTSFQWLDMINTIPAIMTNASMTLLTGLYASSGHNYLSETATTCEVQSLTYSYYPLRLFLPYAVAACITAFCILIGFRTIQRHGKEETLDYHRLVDAISRNDLPSA